MDLSRETRALLDSARMADSAPSDVRHRTHQRLVGALAAGTISTSALMAKGASLGVLGAAAGSGTTVAASSSFAVTLISAAATGLALGLVALSPASTVPDQTVVATTAKRAAPATLPMTTGATRGVSVAAPSAPPLDEPPAPESSVRTETAATVARSQTSPSIGVASRMGAPLAVAAPPSEVAPQDQATSSNANTPLDGSVPPRPTKASIARETELLAQVQRALQTGRPATALAKLNQYNAEFPSGMLREEAIASRVMALCAFGRDKDAARWTAEFFVRYPNSPLSARVRGACRSVPPATVGDSSRSK